MATKTLKFSNIVVIVFVFIFSATNASFLSFNHGVLEARSGTTKDRFCIIFYPNITSFPTEKTKSSYQPIVDLSPWDGCTESNRTSDIEGRYVIITNGSCSLIRKAQVLGKLKAEGMLIVMPRVMHLDDNVTYSIDIPVALIGQSSKEMLMGLGDHVEVFIYAPVESSHMDYSLLVIWTLAVITVGIGAYWSGLVRHDLQKQSRLPPTDVSADGKAIPQEEVSLSVTPVLVGVFVLCMCGMLLLLYFFFSCLVYVIIGLFLLASTTAVYQCLEPLVRRGKIGAQKFTFNSRCFLVEVELRQLILLIGAISLSASWFYYRKAKFAWALQDILGFAFSVNMLRLVRLPSLKICTLLLVLLFFYDIFFVFITPLFTKNGQSVMVEVATGGGSGPAVGTGGSSGSSSGEEQLPMVVRVPHLGKDPLDVCWQRYSLLGFGDILVPGMLVAFCHGFDLATSNRRKLYFITTLLAYGLGLLVTFAGLYLMAVAQPALLYLVPCTLIPVFLLGLIRHEWRLLWEGDSQTGEITRLTDGTRVEDGGSCNDTDPDLKAELPSEKVLNGSKDRHSLLSVEANTKSGNRQQTADQKSHDERNIFFPVG